jgi:2-polyprenyl-3-methyl-5-hydroxy-6-metoxy-1,4-benzoquinol methylase
MKVLSPLTHRQSVTLQEKLDSKRIVAQYEAEYAFDARPYFENVDSVALYQCNETGYRFFYPPRVAGGSDLYEHLQKLPWYYKSWKWEYDVADKYITERDYVLDVGCGFGAFLHKLHDRNVRCAGLEFNPQAAETAASNGLQVYPETINHHARNNPGKYSVVCAFQVLEHIEAAGDFIADCLKAIKPYGKLIIGVPNNNPFLYKHDKYNTLNVPPHHMGLWDKKSLKNLQKVFPLRPCSFRIEPLSEEHERYCRAQLEYLSSKSPWLGKLADRIFRPYNGRYFRAQLEYLSSKSPWLGKLADRIFRPYNKPLMKVIARFVEGRNILAVYTKLPDNDRRHTNQG